MRATLASSLPSRSNRSSWASSPVSPGTIARPFTADTWRPSTGGIFIGSQEAQLRQLLQPLLGIGTPKVTIKTMPYLDAWLHFAAPPDPPHPDKFSNEALKDVVIGIFKVFNVPHVSRE